MTTPTFETILARAGLKPADIERAQATHLRSDEQLDGGSSGLRTHLITVRTAAELRAVMNPTDQVHHIKIPHAGRTHAGDAPAGASWAQRQHGRPHAHRAHALDILYAAVLGPHSALNTLGTSVEKAWLPNRVAVMAAQSLTILAGAVHVLGINGDRSTACSFIFDTVTIQPGGQLVLANPTTLTITTLNRSAN